MEASMFLFAACLHHAVLPNAIFCCRPRMNVSGKAWLPHPTPNPQWGHGGYTVYPPVGGGGGSVDWDIYGSAYRRPPPNRHPSRPHLWVRGVGMGKPCASASFMHVLHHMAPGLHQNATSACTAVVQKPTKLCQTGSNGGFPLISLRNPSNLLAWPSIHPGDPTLSGGGLQGVVQGQASLLLGFLKEIKGKLPLELV